MVLTNTPLICLDCEFTGLDPEHDRIVELAAARFFGNEILDTIELLVNPGCEISPASYAIHHISEEMIHKKPPIEEILPQFFQFVGTHPIIGHAIGCDLNMLEKAAERSGIPYPLKNTPCIDTLRLARLYGDSPNNSLKSLAQ